MGYIKFFVEAIARFQAQLGKTAKLVITERNKITDHIGDEVIFCPSFKAERQEFQPLLRQFKSVGGREPSHALHRKLWAISPIFQLESQRPMTILGCAPAQSSCAG